jgi:hypothetical protein
LYRPGISAVSPPISAQHASRHPCATPFTTCAPTFRRQLSGREIVEKEQRLGALHDEVVDRHGDEIDADRLVAAGFDRDQHLGADTVGPRDQHGVLEPRALQVEQAAEPADFAVRARSCGRAHQRFDQLDHAIAGVDVDAGIRIREPVALVVHAVCPTSEPRATQCPHRSSPHRSLARRRARFICQLRLRCRGRT